MALIDDLKAAAEDYTYFGSLDEGLDDVELVEDELCDTTRWHNWYRAIKRGDEYVSVHYGVGATEMQENDEYPTFAVVTPVERTVIAYVEHA